MKVWASLWRMKRIIAGRGGWGDGVVGGVTGGEGIVSKFGDGEGGRWELALVEAVLALSRGFGSRPPLIADSGLGADGRIMGDTGTMGYREREPGASLVGLVLEKYSRLEPRLGHRSSGYPNIAVEEAALALDRGLANLGSCTGKSGPEAAERTDGNGGRIGDISLGR